MSLGLVVLLAAVSLTTCDDDPGAAGPTSPRAVRTMLVDQGGADAYRTLPGVLTAAETMRLAFPVAGRLIDVPLRAGDRVVEGEQIARLDPAEITREITAKDRITCGGLSYNISGVIVMADDRRFLEITAAARSEGTG